jgi:translation initiation factor IF-2
MWERTVRSHASASSRGQTSARSRWSPIPMALRGCGSRGSPPPPGRRARSRPPRRYREGRPGDHWRSRGLRGGAGPVATRLARGERVRPRLARSPGPRRAARSAASPRPRPGAARARRPDRRRSRAAFARARGRGGDPGSPGRASGGPPSPTRGRSPRAEGAGAEGLRPCGRRGPELLVHPRDGNVRAPAAASAGDGVQARGRGGAVRARGRGGAARPRGRPPG